MNIDEEIESYATSLRENHQRLSKPQPTMKNNDPELTPTAAAANDYENNPAKYATTPAPKLDRREMMMGTNSLIEPDHKAMLARLRDIAANATLHQQVTIDEADLRQLLAWADAAVFA